MGRQNHVRRLIVASEYVVGSSKCNFRSIILIRQAPISYYWCIKRSRRVKKNGYKVHLKTVKMSSLIVNISTQQCWMAYCY